VLFGEGAERDESASPRRQEERKKRATLPATEKNMGFHLRDQAQKRKEARGLLKRRGERKRKKRDGRSDFSWEGKKGKKKGENAPIPTPMKRGDSCSVVRERKKKKKRRLELSVEEKENTVATCPVKGIQERRARPAVARRGKIEKTKLPSSSEKRGRERKKKQSQRRRPRTTNRTR